MTRVIVSLLTILLMMSSAAVAQQSEPVVIPATIQEMAIKFPVAQRLGIKWGSASPEDVGRYMGLLAAVSVLADQIARANDRKLPSVDDDLAAFAAMCLWPPNKPPLAEPYWASASRAFDNGKDREALRGAVGHLALSLPKEISVGKGEETVLTTWPQTSAGYFEKVLNLERLGNGR